MAVQFGVASAPGSYGYIQNFTENAASEIGEARDENGDVAAFNHYNETVEATFEYVFDGTAPEVGDTLTITCPMSGAKNFTILTVAMAETNTDYQRMTVTARHYVPNSLPST